MGTPNFASPSNASKYFVVLTNREENYKECPECGELHYEGDYSLEELNECTSCKTSMDEVQIESQTIAPDTWECQDLIDNIGNEIEAIGGKMENESFRDQNYARQSLGVLESTKSYGDVELVVKLTAILQSAYYEGATLDYIIQIEANGETFDHSTGSYYDEDLDNIIESAFDPYYSDMNPGLCKIMQPKALTWVEGQIEELSNQLEALYEAHSEHKLGCTGVFSNGEAVYHAVA